MSECTYESTRRVTYGEGATFVPVCATCGRFVKSPPAMTFNGAGQPVTPNATCSRCGATAMLFEGWY